MLEEQLAQAETQADFLGCVVGVAQNSRAGVTQVLVFGSIYQDAIFVHSFEPLPPLPSELAMSKCLQWGLAVWQSGRSGGALEDQLAGGTLGKVSGGTRKMFVGVGMNKLDANDS